VDFYANYLYVKDVVRAYLLAGQTPSAEHMIFNISGSVHRCSEVVEILKSLIPNLVINYKKSLDTPNPIDAYNLSPARAKEELGYGPAYTLAEAVQDFIKTRKELGHLYTSSSSEYAVTPL
jgi:nucleoside-diphosphate-sugar epimerase